MARPFPYDLAAAVLVDVKLLGGSKEKFLELLKLHKVGERRYYKFLDRLQNQKDPELIRATREKLALVQAHLGLKPGGVESTQPLTPALSEEEEAAEEIAAWLKPKRTPSVPELMDQIRLWMVEGLERLTPALPESWDAVSNTYSTLAEVEQGAIALDFYVKHLSEAFQLAQPSGSKPSSKDGKIHQA